MSQRISDAQGVLRVASDAQGVARVVGTAKEASAAVSALGSEERRATSMRFFKTGKGQYAEGDVFVGVTVPALRSLAKSARGLPLSEVAELLARPVHEERMLALFLLLHHARKGGDALQEVFRIYEENLAYVNNWDLVDVSAEGIAGAYSAEFDPGLLERFAGDRQLFVRRIGMVGTYFGIKRKAPEGALRIAKLLLQDREDLIHKAVGWMLREVGKRDPERLEGFLREHHKSMPRTALRYAIEKMTPEERRHWMR